jgi:hypothetical protein
MTKLIGGRNLPARRVRPSEVWVSVGFGRVRVGQRMSRWQAFWTVLLFGWMR